jgi:hypothetical protein
MTEPTQPSPTELLRTEALVSSAQAAALHARQTSYIADVYTQFLQRDGAPLTDEQFWREVFLRRTPSTLTAGTGALAIVCAYADGALAEYRRRYPNP